MYHQQQLFDLVHVPDPEFFYGSFTTEG